MVWMLIGLASVLAIGFICLKAVRCGRDEDRLRERLGDGADLVFGSQPAAAVVDPGAAPEADADREERIDGYHFNTFI